MKHLFLTIFALAFAATDIQAQRIKGSDTVLPIAQQTAERFMTLNPNARVTVTGGGSGVGISALLDETTDIAMVPEASIQREDESESSRRRTGRNTGSL